MRRVKTDTGTGRFVREDKALEGKTFNELTAVSPIFKKGRWYWNCSCSCGNTTCVAETRLINGKVKSCGCYSKRKHINSLALGEANANAQYSAYKRSAKTRGLEFAISKEEFRELTMQDCYYCSASPKCKTYNSRNYGAWYGNGIDRVNNEIGYVFDNCFPCCRNCNIAKASLTEEEFYSLVTRVYEKHCRPTVDGSVPFVTKVRMDFSKIWD